MENKKLCKIGIVLIACFIIFIVVFLVLFLHKKDMVIEEIPGEEGPIVEISYEEVEFLYNELMQDCNGAILWDIQDVSQVHMDQVKDHCSQQNYYSKLIGFYTDENSNGILDVAVLHQKENDLYDLEDHFVGKYNQENMDTLFESGSVYRYTFGRSKDSYILKTVEFVNREVLLVDYKENYQKKSETVYVDPQKYE